MDQSDTSQNSYFFFIFLYFFLVFLSFAFIPEPRHKDFGTHKDCLAAIFFVINIVYKRQQSFDVESQDKRIVKKVCLILHREREVGVHALRNCCHISIEPDLNVCKLPKSDNSYNTRVDEI